MGGERAKWKGERANLDTLFIFMPFCIHRSLMYKYITLISLCFLLTVADEAIQSYFLSKNVNQGGNLVQEATSQGRANS